MNLSATQLQVVYDAVKRVYPNEAVIGITARKAIPLTNIHPEPLDHFLVDSNEFYKHKFKGLVHSHTRHPSKPSETYTTYYDIRTPSMADMQLQQSLDMPMGIIGYDGENMTEVLWFPDIDSSIMDKPFIYGVYDCFRVAKAWYWQNKKIKLIDHPREFDWRQVHDLFNSKYKEAGFESIDKSLPLIEGDLVLFKINSEYENHVGVYVGDGKILHHFSNRAPAIENYAKWRSKITKHLRYRGNDKKN